jgi:hypothetical protein
LRRFTPEEYLNLSTFQHFNISIIQFSLALNTPLDLVASSSVSESEELYTIILTPPKKELDAYPFLPKVCLKTRFGKKSAIF